ncbi:MAG: PAS domain S-box protein, partial [Steroidobacteraceae bacterium]|nr:PAS domain S-box protein [Steroidobacteraceae bacterium]MDW8257972.1 PAS domain S-box protein [Gammaproteobacteria bacterium]
MQSFRTESSRELLHAIVTLAGEAIIATDSELRIVLFNHGAESIFGYAAAEVIGRPLNMLIPPAYRAAHDAHMRRFAESTTATRRMGDRARVVGLRRNGDVFEIEASISHFTVAGQRQFAVVLRDVSDTLREQAALRASEARFRTMLDAVTEYVWLLDPSGRILQVGRAALELLDLRADAVLGGPFAQSPWWAHAADLRRRVQDALLRAASGTPDAFDATHPTSCGDVVDVEFSVTPVRGDAGAVIALLAEGRDITARKRAERAHLDSEARLERIVAHSPDHIFLQDRDLRYTWVRNPIAGLDVSDYLGATDEQLAKRLGIEADTAARLEASKRDVIETGQPRTIELEVNGINGPRYFEATLEPMRDAVGEIVGVLGFARDRTETRTALRELAAAKEAAERAAQAKSRLLAIVSHDLRQPLQTVSLLAGVVERRVSDPATLETVQQLERALASANELLSTLLNLSRLESGALQPHFSWVDIADLCQRLREELQAKASEKKLALTVDVPPVEVWSDRQWLRQVLQNLLANALRYTLTGGAVALRAWPQGEDLCVAVSDTGVGIPADKL